MYIPEYIHFFFSVGIHSLEDVRSLLDSKICNNQATAIASAIDIVASAHIIVVALPQLDRIHLTNKELFFPLFTILFSTGRKLVISIHILTY